MPNVLFGKGKSTSPQSTAPSTNSCIEAFDQISMLFAHSMLMLLTWDNGLISFI